MRRRSAIIWMMSCVLSSVGCHMKDSLVFDKQEKIGPYRKVATAIEYPDVKACSRPEAVSTMAPRLINDDRPLEYRELTLQEAVQTALQNSEVMRDLGGQVLTSPVTATTVYEPAIQDSDPIFGTEGALSNFDATLASSMFWQRNDRTLNNQVFGGGTTLVDQDTGDFNLEINKTAATGTTFAARNITNYDSNNAPQNEFVSAWDVLMEAEVTHPFLQGSGLAFNRIAGPNASPGFLGTSGVLVARVNNDISLADFELAVRDLVSDVENAYWELYFAYRDLEARKTARNSSLQTWRRVNALYETGRAGGEADKEAQAREQYYLFEAQVQAALAGTPGRGTVSGNGSTGGFFQGAGGVYASERRLRYIMGLPATDGLLLRPSDEPSSAKIVFNWEEILPEALTRRAELRRQKWEIKRRELELIAARNFLLPRLDGVALYRWRGFGDHLLRFDNDNRQQFDNAMQNLFDGDFEEWQLGLQFNMPIGFRQAMAAVRNAELQLARAKAVYREQELTISHDLSAAVADLDRAFVLSRTNFNRRVAAQAQLEAVETSYEAGTATLDLLLDAQRRLAEADTAYYRSLVEYNLALKNLQMEKGTLLEYNGVVLAEGPWKHQAYLDAKELGKRMRKMKIDYGCDCNDKPFYPKTLGYPGLVSGGLYDQDTLDGEIAIQQGDAPAPMMVPGGTPSPAPAVEAMDAPPAPELPGDEATAPQPYTIPQPTYNGGDAELPNFTELPPQIYKPETPRSAVYRPAGSEGEIPMAPQPGDLNLRPDQPYYPGAEATAASYRPAPQPNSRQETPGFVEVSSQSEYPRQPANYEEIPFTELPPR